MNSENKNPSAKNEQEKKNEGGREFGHVHEPTQAQQASRNQGHAGNQPQIGQQQDERMGQQQGGAGTHQGTGSQQGKQPGKAMEERQSDPRKEQQRERKPA